CTLEPCRIGADPVGEIGDGPSFIEIAGFDVLPERHRRRLHIAEAVFAQYPVIGDEEGADLAPLLAAAAHHGLAEIMVGIRLVDETAARARPRDHPRLRAADETRERAERAVRLHR